MSRTLALTRMGFREQARRPVLIALLVGVPFFFITRAIAVTEQLPRTIQLPGGAELMTNMRLLHGADMAAITVAFLGGLVGVFVMQSAREGDRRLVVAGYRPLEAIGARLALLVTAVVLVAAVSVAVTALSFDAQQWGWFALAILLAGLTYAAIGALAGAVLGRLGATYLMFFLPTMDPGIAQNPMFGDGTPDGWAHLLPSYGATRVLLDAAFSGDGFHAGGDLLLAFAWVIALGVAVALILSRSVAPHGTHR